MIEVFGVLDSPFGRRVCIVAGLYNIPVNLIKISAYQNVDLLAEINSTLTTPTVRLSDNTILIDSAAIIDYFVEIVGREKCFMPPHGVERRDTLQLIDLINLSCEKIGQLWRELSYRPPERIHPPIVERMKGQVRVAFGLLEQRVSSVHGQFFPTSNHANIFGAIAYRFANDYYPDLVSPQEFRRLSIMSARAEETPAFKAASF